MKTVFSIIQRCLNLFSNDEKKKLYGLAILVLLMSVVELFGVVSILPFMSVATNPEMIETNSYLNYAYQRFGFESSQSFLLMLGFFALAALIIGNAVRALTSLMLLRFAQTQNHYLSKRVLRNYLYRPYEYFLSQNSSDVTKIVLGEVNHIVSTVIQPLLKAMARATTALLIILMLILLNPKVALVMSLALGAAYVLIYKTLKKKVTVLGKERVKANQIRYRLVSEASGGIKEIKLMNKEEVYLDDFQGPSLKYALAQAHNAVMSDLPKYALEVVAFGGILGIVMYLIASEGHSQAISLTALYAFAGYKLLPSLQEIFAAVTKIRFNLPTLALVEKSLEGAQENHRTESVDTLQFNQQIELKSLSFKYAQAKEFVIEDLSLSIPKNKTIGIIGTTGSGKTTLVDLILGLLRPQSGTISIDGNNLCERNLSSWQRQIGYVPQFIYLSDNSIAANIAFGIPADKIDLKKVEAAARLALIHDFIVNELAHGYQTEVGERGIRLSGGQRQRIGLARALYSDPSLLVFDEATSALDNETEKIIMESIRELTGKKTIMMIAHRLSTVKDVDILIKVNKGKVEILNENERDSFINKQFEMELK